MIDDAKSVTDGNGYSAEELAQLKLPGYPVSRKGWYDRVRRDGWEIREEPGKGPGGIRQVFVPPPNVRKLIEDIERANMYFFGDSKPQKPHAVQEPSAPAYMPAPEGFILVPRYDVTGSMGNGHVIHSEQIVDHLAFRAEWVRTELGTSPSSLVLISAVGDSMEPTLRAHDLLLIDRSVLSVKQDAIYAFAVDGELRVKRIQRLFDGSLIIKSDNQEYATETLTPQQAETINIIGRVVWSGRRM
jgi:phage repressor protein C with HTH and peptisase S24 domain